MNGTLREAIIELGRQKSANASGGRHYVYKCRTNAGVEERVFLRGSPFLWTKNHGEAFFFVTEVDARRILAEFSEELGAANIGR